MMNRNRKRIASAVFAAALLAAGFAGVSGQAARGSGNLRKIDTESFIFKGLQDPLLYAETDYAVNPGVLQRLEEPLLTTDVSTAMNSSASVNTRLDETFGSIGGTYSARQMLLQPSIEAGFILPLGDDRKVPIFGAAANFDMTYDNIIDEYVNYNAFSESIRDETTDLTWSAGTELSFAVNVKNNLLGFALGYEYAGLPKLYSLISDDTLTGGPYVDEEIRGYDQQTHSGSAKVGAVVPLSRAAELSLSLNYRGDFIDRADKYITLDGDGDGYLETIQHYADYYAAAGADYDSKDLTIGTDLTFHPLIRLYVSDSVEMFISGEYTILDVEDRTYYQRVRYINDLTSDESMNREISDSSFTSFAALAGLAVKSGDDGLIKFGIAYDREDRRIRQEGIGAAGVNVYSRLNDNNYTELNLGLEPLNNSISSVLDTPTEALTQSLRFQLGYENHPFSGLSTYLLLNVTGTDRRQTYYAYNLDTRSVWYEDELSRGLVWNIEPVGGIALKVGKKKEGVWSVHLRGTGSTGDLGSASESAPFDTFLGRTSSNGEIDSSSSNNFNFEVSTGFLFVF